MTKLCYDAAEPPTIPPATDAVLIYSGGDADHIWSHAEISTQTARYRVPCWVRSDPSSANASDDASSMLNWLQDNSAPPGTAIMLDLETAVNPAYVNVFGTAMHAADYLVLPYGSEDDLFQNPVLDGYWLAEPDATAIDPRCVATQFAYEDAYDLSWIADSVPLWDTQPAPTPAPTPIPIPGVEVESTYITFEIAGGNGWAPAPVPAGNIVSVALAEFNPEVVGSYGTPPVWAGVADQAGPNSPNGAIVFKGTSDGVFGAMIWYVP